MKELKHHALLSTIYRPPHATRAITELSEEGTVERVAARGHDKTIIRLAPPTLF